MEDIVEDAAAEATDDDEETFDATTGVLFTQGPCLEGGPSRSKEAGNDLP